MVFCGILWHFMVFYTKFYLNPFNSCRYEISAKHGVPPRHYVIINILMNVSGFAVETGNMRAGTQLLRGLKKTGRTSVSVTGQRLQSTVVQHAADEHLDSGSEFAASAKPYSSVPGPRQLPLIGNAWRFLPYIGKCGVSYEYHVTALSLFDTLTSN